MKSLLTGLLCLIVSTAAAVRADVTPVLPVPTEQQKEWQEDEIIFFVHFGINTFTGREWGDGSESPSLFSPTRLDPEQWVKAVKSAGGTMLILTAKHHDGFCLWPSQYTEHSVKNSPWKNGEGDIVFETAEACDKHDIKFGVYLSPWDRNHPDYGDSPKYNQYFLSQLEELLTNYGDIAEVWFDGANGEGPNGKRQVYDFDAYYSLIRELQPDAVIAIMGPDVRWVGNEDGIAAETEWSVRVLEKDSLNDPKIMHNPTVVAGPVRHLDKAGKNREDAAFSHLADDPASLDGLAPMMWHPAETDVSIRPGWFYHEDQDDKVKSLEHLVNIYYQSVGRNSVLLLNVPPDPRGLFHENDVMRLMEFGAYVRDTFAENFAVDSFLRLEYDGVSVNNFSDIIDGDSDSFPEPLSEGEEKQFTIVLDEPVTFDVVMLQEPIGLGQRIAGFNIAAKGENGGWTSIAEGTTVGYKRLLRVNETTAEQIRITITKSRGTPLLSEFGLFKEAPYVE